VAGTLRFAEASVFSPPMLALFRGVRCAERPCHPFAIWPEGVKL